MKILRFHNVLLLAFATVPGIVSSHTIEKAHYDETDQSLHVPSVSADSLSFFDVVLSIDGDNPITVNVLEAEISANPINRGNYYDSENEVLYLSDVLVDGQTFGAEFQKFPASSSTQFSFLKAYANTTCAEYLPVFEAYTGLVSAYCDEDYLHIESLTGLPEISPSSSADRAGVGISAWILRVPLPYHYQWKIPLNPQWSAERIEATPKGPIAVAVNGVPIFHYERRPDVSTFPEDYDAGSDTVLQGELDQCGGHAGQGDDYHYHYAPVCLLDEQEIDLPIAFGLDGVPIYYGTGATDYYGSGRFTALNGLPAQTLDECNALDNNDGTFSYYTTSEPPYLLGCHRAIVDAELRIEPRPLSGREQGTENPYGGEFGEPTTTLVTDFYRDSDGAYHFEHESFTGSGTSAVIYKLLDSESNCWEFEYRADKDLGGVKETACRTN